MKEYIWYIVFVVFLSMGAISGDDHSHHPEANVAYCQPYCDVNGYYKPGAWCISYVDLVYCCGSEHSRVCCTDPDRDITGVYDPTTECPNSSWWVYHWRVIIGLLGTLMMVLIVSSCCYYCCVHSFSRRRRREASNRRETELPSVAASGGATGGIPPFDPQHPYAFTPPDYDSLPKEPPKYAEIFDSEAANANTNGAFEPDLPPPSSPVGGEDPQTPPPGYQDAPVRITSVFTHSDTFVNPFTAQSVQREDTVNPSAN